MGKRFRITVNGQVYDVEVEELDPATGAPRPPMAVTLPPPPAWNRPAGGVAPAVPAAPAAAAVRVAPAAAGPAGAVTAPLPGIVAAVRCEVGQTVQAGQVLLVLEAMKMENEVIAPAAGKVEEIRVAKGTAVSAGDVLVVLG